MARTRWGVLKVTTMALTTASALPWHAIPDICSMPPVLLGHSIITYASEQGMGWEAFVTALRDDSRHNNTMIHALANLTVFVMTKLVAESEVNARIVEWEQIKNAEWSRRTHPPRATRGTRPRRTRQTPERYSDTWCA